MCLIGLVGIANGQSFIRVTAVPEVDINVNGFLGGIPISYISFVGIKHNIPLTVTFSGFGDPAVTNQINGGSATIPMKLTLVINGVFSFYEGGSTGINGLILNLMPQPSGTTDLAFIRKLAILDNQYGGHYVNHGMMVFSSL